MDHNIKIPDNDIMNEFKDRLKVLLKEKGYTAKNLGDMTEIGHRTIEGWLGSKNIMPRADSAVKVAQVLNTSVEYLVTGIDPNTKDPSALKRNFYNWVDSMSEEELKGIVNLFEVFDGIGKQLGK